MFTSLSLSICILIHTSDRSNLAKDTNLTLSVVPKSSPILCINIWRRMWETHLFLLSSALSSTPSSVHYHLVSNMGSEGSHNTQNDTPLVHIVRQRRKKRKKFGLQVKVEELVAQNNRISMKNEILQEQYEKLFGILHEDTRSHEPIALVNVNHHLGAL